MAVPERQAFPEHRAVPEQHTNVASQQQQRQPPKLDMRVSTDFLECSQEHRLSIEDLPAMIRMREPKVSYFYMDDNSSFDEEREGGDNHMLFSTYRNKIIFGLQKI